MFVAVDESMVQRGQSAYLLAAVCIEDHRRAAVRSAARQLVPRRRRFHFHQEEDREKQAMMELIAAEAVAAHLLVAAPCHARRLEGIRQRLLLDLAMRLSRRRAMELSIESRGPHNDRLDRITLVEASRKSMVARDVSYGHRHPDQEALLWLADGLAGAGRADLVLRQARWLRFLPEGILTVRRFDGRGDPADLKRRGPGVALMRQLNPGPLPGAQSSGRR